MIPSTRSADVIVIGAGVIGLSTAFELLRAGLRVTVLERGAVGPGGASWAGGGILAPLEPDAVGPSALPLLRDSLAVYAEWCAALHEASGIDPEYLVSGLRILPPGDLPAWKALAASCAIRAEDGEAGALLQLPGVAQVRSPRLLRALARAVRAAGGQILEGVPVQALQRSGEAMTVMTVSGPHRAARVVLAAGAWSAQLAPSAGVRPMRGEMLLLDARSGELASIVLRAGQYLIPRKDGGIVAGSTLEDIGFENQPSTQGRDRILSAVHEMAPWLAQREVLAHWSGLRPGAQSAPQVGWSPDQPRLFLNCGHYRLGITLAPGSARAAARQILAA